MNRYFNIITFGLIAFSIKAAAQHGSLSGTVTSNGFPVPATTVSVLKTSLGNITDSVGNYSIQHIPSGLYKISASAIGYKTIEKNVVILKNQHVELNFQLPENISSLDQVVVTGTRTPKRKTNSAVIVNLINSKTLAQTIAANLFDGLKYQPGLRVETDCQTCNYTQLRMNGLQGGYSQILINSRPVFSPLTGLYGMEQIPTSMIDKIEVVKGGVSALYGSSAIGGTVNVITKKPTETRYELSNTFQRIKNQTTDNIISGNASLVNDEGNAGISVFMNNRNRAYYDANGDNFSELPMLKDNSFGTNVFFKPTEHQKLELSLSSIYEYRFGGEKVKKPAYLAEQSEERTHNVLMGSADYPSVSTKVKTR